jgi:glycosyltransferase involved in cell wall biosynthesis
MDNSALIYSEAIMTKLYLAIPCYNEEEVLRDSAQKLSDKFSKMMLEGKITDDSKIVFIDDGSKDKTWSIISELHSKNPVFQGIKLSRNRGHQNALLCGLITLKDKADAVISIDADLQDDINTFDEMVEKYENGCDVVYGVRSKRETDTFFKRFTAEAFYKILNKMGAKVIFNHADFRLMSKRALNAFAEYKETNIFLRGMVPLIGYKSDIVTYERFERLAGESKYPLKKMLALAWEGITSLSIQPIRMITGLGAVVFAASIIMIIYSLVSYFMGFAVIGWASLLCSIWAIGGLQILAIGVIGEYIGKIYLEVKRRPRFIVEEFLED